jgi:hypothetical protein
MRGVRLDRLAADLAADLAGSPGEPLLDQHGGEQDDQRERCGRVMGRDDLAHRLDRDSHGGDDHHAADHQRRHRFGLAVAEGVARVRLAPGDPQAAPDDERGEDVRGRLDAVGDQGVGVTEHSGGELRRCQSGVHQNAGAHRADRLVEPRGIRAVVAHRLVPPVRARGSVYSRSR